MRNERQKTKYIIVHSTNTTPDKNIGAKEITSQDRKDGWLTCRFHKIITRDGSVEDGRDIRIAGTHVDSVTEVYDVTNANSIGICLVGGAGSNDTPDCNFTLKQYNKLSELVVSLKQEYSEAVILGHRDVANVKSPQFNVAELLS